MDIDREAAALVDIIYTTRTTDKPALRKELADDLTRGVAALLRIATAVGANR